MKFWTCQHMGQNKSHFKTLFQMKSLVADHMTSLATHTYMHANSTHVRTHTLPPSLLHDFWNHRQYDQNSWRDPIRGHAAASRSGSCAWKPCSSTVGPHALKETEEWGWPFHLAKWAAAHFEAEQRLWRALVCTELNSNHKYVFKSFKIFNLAEIWFLSLI